MMTIDLNSDVAEGMGNEAELFPFITSCNIACGAHAGTPKIIDKAIVLAHKHGLKIGAHPSYPDRENFGRKEIDMPLKKLEDSLINQILFINKRCTSISENPINHVKFHGALYNASFKSKDIATTAVKAVLKSVPNAKLYVSFGSMIEKVALKHKLKVRYEVFADRHYQNDLSLVPRLHPNAVITDKFEVVRHVLHMILNQKVKTLSGFEVPIKASTCCVHGDNEKAIEIVKFLHTSLINKGIVIE